MDDRNLVQMEALPTYESNDAGAAHLNEDRLAKGIDAAEVMRILKRRKVIILACIVVVMSISAANIFQIVPRYTAESAVILEARKTQVVDVQAVLSGLPADVAVIRSEVEVLRAPAIAERVVRKLNLHKLPEFNPDLRQPTGFGAMLDAAKPLLGMKRGAPTSALAPMTPEQELAAVQGATNILHDNIEVTNELKTYVLKIRVESEDPQLAAQIANAYATAYLDSQLEEKFNAVRRANTWLNDHLTELRTAVESTDHAVQDFKAKHNLTATNGITINAQQLGEINSQLMQATAERAQKESAYRQIDEQIKASGVSAASQVLTSPLIEKLHADETDLLSKRAQAATKYLPAHPTMVNLDAQIKDTQEKIKEESDKIVRGMASDVAAAKAKEGALRESLRELQKSAEQQGDAEVQLHQLEREAESNRALYQNFLLRFKQTSNQEDNQQADARLLARAQVPGGPSYPQTNRLLMIAFGGSVLVGLLAAFAVEQLDPGFRTREQFERATKVPSLGLVPNEADATMSAIDLVVKNPICPYSEAIRTIRTALRYSQVDTPPKVVMVTSSLPGEGKSVFALSLARSVASSGGRSLLIDCDLRRPSIATALHIPYNLGLLSLFDEGVDVAKAISVDAGSGMHVITCPPGTPSPQDLLGSNHLKALIRRFRAEYDLVVLDTPPVLSVSDALLLSHIADTTIYLVRWGESSRQVVSTGLRTFRIDGGQLAGAVLTRVDMVRHMGYSYGEDRYAYGRYYTTPASPPNTGKP